MAGRRQERATRDPRVEHERRERERRERERLRSTASPREAAAARVRREGLIVWLPRMVAAVLRGFVLEVVAIFSNIGRATLRLAPSGARRAEGSKSAPVATPRRARARTRDQVALRRRIRIGVAVLLALGVAAAWFVVPASSVFRIRHVEVRGTAAVDDLQVREQVDSLLRGKTIFTVDHDALARRIEQLPFVSSVTIDRHLPGGLELRVHEYEPLALAYGGGDFWLISHDGRVLSKVDGNAWKGRIPTIMLRGDDIHLGARLNDEPALQLLEAVPAGASIQFDTVRVDEDELEATLPDGVVVRFGRVENLTLKVAVAERVLQLAERNGQDLLYIDVSVPGKPVRCLDETAACHLPRGTKDTGADASTSTDETASTAPDAP